MSAKAKSESVARRKLNCPEEEAFTSLLLTADVLSRKVERLLRQAGVSPTQYNVLRILRGSPQGLPCSEIGKRMINRDPDITRLLDRLEKRGLVSRCRENEDRRLVQTRITPEGLSLLAALDEPVVEMHRTQLGHLGRERLQALMELLQASREKAG
jgi:DNA-binding MarR family transcriptional regulator